VQWHPELDALSDPRPMRIFEALIERARGYGRPRASHLMRRE
jgi:gamma-glutamyl-gamma-aminobutyrate hydrolase PuuD